MSNLGRWQWWYDKQQTGGPFGFDDGAVFQVGADWLADCETVADWGCGGGMLSRFIRPDRYIGVDGSKTPAVDVVADLEDYHEHTDGIFMRSVLEHNYRWERVLDNALGAFDKRMVLAIFTPWHLGDEDDDEDVADVHLIRFERGFEVPTLAFRQEAIEAKLDGLTWELVEMKATGAYASDRVFLIERP